MEHVGVRDLRANLAARVRQAAAGERVVLTVDGRAVAQLGPLDATEALTIDTLAAAGLVDPPRRHDRPAPPEATDTAVDVRLERVLDEIRGA